MASLLQRRALNRAALFLAARLLLCVSSVCGQNVEAIAVPPATMRCVSYCETFQDVELGAGGSGYARIYRDTSSSWGFVNVTLPDTGNVPVDSSNVAHIHELECDASGASETGPAKYDDTVFLWTMNGTGTTNRYQSAEYDVIVPSAALSSSVVVHGRNSEQHICCTLQPCEPPGGYQCVAACNEAEWVILDEARVAAVGGTAALWNSEGAGGGTFSVVDVTLRGEAAGIANATLTGALHSGSAAAPGAVWTDASAGEEEGANVSISLPPPLAPLAPRMQTSVSEATAPALSALGTASFVLSVGGEAIASCPLSPCSSFPPTFDASVVAAEAAGEAEAAEAAGSGDGGGPAVVGIVVGAVTGCALLAAIVVAIVLGRRKRLAAKREAGSAVPPSSYPEAQTTGPYKGSPYGTPAHVVGPYKGADHLGGPSSHAASAAASPAAHMYKVTDGLQQPMSGRSYESGGQSLKASSLRQSFLTGTASLEWLETQAVTTSTMAMRSKATTAALREGGPTERERLEQALDDLRTQGTPFMGLYDVLSRFERRVGGQGVVQFVRDVGTAAGHAVKFFFNQSAFERERGLYKDPTLRSMMAATRHVCANDDDSAPLLGPNGYRFPPYIVIEQGEPLDEWIKRMVKRSSHGVIEVIDVVKALINIADRISALREAGYVHRDIKPSNVLWLTGMHAWTLIDFGSTAAVGEEAELSFTLAYAAPEVLAACEAGQKTFAAHPAADVWALGVIAFEMLTGEPLSQTYSEPRVVIDMLLGRAPLPWEGSRRAELLKKLRVFRVHVLECLNRDPKLRPSISSVVRGWEALFRSETATAAGGTHAG